MQHPDQVEIKNVAGWNGFIASRVARNVNNVAVDSIQSWNGSAIIRLLAVVCPKIKKITMVTSLSSLAAYSEGSLQIPTLEELHLSISLTGGTTSNVWKRTMTERLEIMANSLIFGPKLKTLRLELLYRSHELLHVTTCVELLKKLRSHPALENLHLILPVGFVLHEQDYQTLVKIPNLTRLNVDGGILSGGFCDKMEEVWKANPDACRKMKRVVPMTDSNITTAAFPLHLFPNLTELNLTLVNDDAQIDWSNLSKMKKLEKVLITMSPENPPYTYELINVVKHLSQIQYLALSGECVCTDGPVDQCPANEEALALIFDYLPNVTKLQLHPRAQKNKSGLATSRTIPFLISSLNPWIHHPHIQQHLIHLVLPQSTSINPLEIVKLKRLKAIRRIDMRAAFSQVFDMLHLSLLSPSMPRGCVLQVSMRKSLNSPQMINSSIVCDVVE
jgi:hypothetical protein